MDMHSAVAIYDTHTAAEGAIKALRDEKFEMKQLSIVGKDFRTEEHAMGFYNAGDRMKFWGKTGAFWGGLWGWLFGAGLFLIPGIGHIIVMGPLLSWELSKGRPSGPPSESWVLPLQAPAFRRTAS